MINFNFFNLIIYLSIVGMVAFGPVYWVSNGYVGLMSSLKLTFFLFFNAAALVFFLRKKIMLPGKVVPISFALSIIVSIISGFRASEIGNVIDAVLTFFIPFLIVLIFFNLEKQGIDTLIPMKAGVVIFTIMTLPVSLNLLTGFPQWFNPFGDVALPVNLTGLGGSRTGWGLGCSLLLPCVLQIFFESKAKYKLPLLILVCSVLVSVFSTAGRGGIICSVIVVMIMLISQVRKNFYFSSSLMIMFISTVTYFLINDPEAFRLESILSGNFSEVSTGRVEANLIAIDVISGNFIVGVGLNGIDLFGYGLVFGSIHNLWLNLMVMGGVFLTLPILFLFIRIAYLSATNFISNENSVFFKSFFCTFLVGVFFSMTEPMAIFGQFFNTLYFWMLLGCFLSKVKV